MSNLMRQYQGQDGEKLELHSLQPKDQRAFSQIGKGELAILWFKDGDSILSIDGIEQNFQQDQLICITAFNKVELLQLGAIELLKWNPAFYCVLIHDSEVSCRGILFYGAASVPAIQLDPENKQILKAVWQVMENELRVHDKFQLEMLQMLLKRILILSTRIFKSQENYLGSDDELKVIRDYNYLVNQHFRIKHAVADYAELMYKSPKSLANLFKKLGVKTPLQFIHERKMIESRRLLHYTDKSITQIADELGFNDVQAYSRFFKKNEGISAQQFKVERALGNFAKS